MHLFLYNKEVRGQRGLWGMGWETPKKLRKGQGVLPDASS